MERRVTVETDASRRNGRDVTVETDASMARLSGVHGACFVRRRYHPFERAAVCGLHLRSW